MVGMQWFLCLALAAPLAQEPLGPLGPQDPYEEIKELFRNIEKDLKEIDRMLLEAGTQPAPTEMENATKKMDELLQKIRSSQKQVVQSIDEILKKIPPDGRQGSGNQNPPPDPNPPRDPGERKRDRTSEKEIQPHPKVPKGNEDSPPPGEKRPAPPPPSDPKDAVKHKNEAGKWGDLPRIYQELFRNQKTDEIPIRYRQWIENYYRRMNQEKP